MSGGLNLWVESTFKWKLINKSIFICKTFPFFTYTMLQYSVTLIVIVTAEKLYAVLFPLKASRLKLNRKRLRYRPAFDNSANSISELFFYFPFLS